MKKLCGFIFGIFLFSISASFADSFAERCPDIVSCAKVVSQMLGQKYVYDGDVKGKWEATPNLELTKENAEVLFSNMLYTNGFTRMPLSVPGIYQILRVRDAKDSAIPTYYGSLKEDPKLPDTWDYATMVYTTVDTANIDEIPRVLRNFMPPSSRIISIDAGKILITDGIANLKKMHTLLKEIDVKPTAEMKRKWAEEKKRRESRAAVERAASAKSEQSAKKQ